jgi:hypothetical protein
MKSRLRLGVSALVVYVLFWAMTATLGQQQLLTMRALLVTGRLVNGETVQWSDYGAVPKASEADAVPCNSYWHSATSPVPFLVILDFGTKDSYDFVCTRSYYLWFFGYLQAIG